MFSLAVAVAILVGGSLWVWDRISPSVLNSEEYWLNPQSITINEPPSWITSEDLLEEVIRDASLDQPLAIQDKGLTQRISLAFESHSWVAHVKRVGKFHPARVEVELVYRAPVATVAVGSQLLPLDHEGVRLPEENFSLVQLRKMPQIAGLTKLASPRVGSAWSDPRIPGALIIAEAFGKDWEAMDLYQLVPSEQPVAGYRDVYRFKLITLLGRQIPWGPQYLVANPEEPSAHSKIENLRGYVEKYKTLDAMTPRKRNAETPRTAREAAERATKQQ